MPAKASAAAQINGYIKILKKIPIDVLNDLQAPFGQSIVSNPVHY
ncbi:hypothetical protein ACOMCU_16435 [Lysinibacillus sp. UGB7]